MNGRILVSKPLYVALAQRKEDRKAQLASQYMQRMAGMRMQQMGQMFQPGAPGYFMPAPIQTQRFYTPAQMAQFRATPRWNAQPQVRPAAQLNQQGAGYPVSAQYRGGVPPRGQPPVVRSVQSARPITGQQPMVPQGMPGRQMGMPAGGPVMPQPRPAGFKFTPAMRNPPAQVTVRQFSSNARVYLILNWFVVAYNYFYVNRAIFRTTSVLLPLVECNRPSSFRARNL